MASENWEFQQNQLVNDRWEGEDESEPERDNWDDSSEEEEKAPPPKPEPPKKGGKKNLKQVLKEKEEKERLAEEERRAKEASKTAEEKLADKLLAQKLTEESDFEITKEMFGTKQAADPNKLTIDNFNPSTKEDYRKMVEMLTKKLQSLESSPHYPFLVEEVMSKAVIPLNPEQLRKQASSINVLANEKAKLEKSKKGKKSTKAKLAGAQKGSKNAAMDDYSAMDDFDDFF